MSWKRKLSIHELKPQAIRRWSYQDMNWKRILTTDELKPQDNDRWTETQATNRWTVKAGYKQMSWKRRLPTDDRKAQAIYRWTENAGYRQINLKHRVLTDELKTQAIDIWAENAILLFRELARLLFTFEPQRQKTYLRHVRQAKIQISLRIHAVWSESSVGAFQIAKTQSFFMRKTLIWLRGCTFYYVVAYTVETQWLEHLWDHGNLFETWVVRATEG